MEEFKKRRNALAYRCLKLQINCDIAKYIGYFCKKIFCMMPTSDGSGLSGSDSLAASVTE